MKELAVAHKDHPLTVAIRIRPISETELDEGSTIIAHKVDDQMVVLMDPTEDPDDILRAKRSREKTYMFDVAFDHTATQEDVYFATTKNLIEAVISGYNATVFAYGPTGAGKTYTMLGTDHQPGIYFRTLNDLFKAIEATSSDMNYTVSISYVEIYNEMIRDLLNTASGYLDLREDSKGGIQIAGITEVSTNNAEEIMQLLMKGNRRRTQEPTAANKTSSRSHAILQVTVRQANRVKGVSEEVRIGRLFMIDLAGSERASQTHNRGKRMKEGAHINRSLLALGNCINALSEKGGGRAQYVNYRDSKLTRLLKDSLGGNTRTVMITHISPASTSFDESRSTLIYANRAKNIKTRVKRNLLNVSYHIAQYTSIIAELRQEIERLKGKIENQGPERIKKDRANIRDVQGEVQQHSAEYSRQEMGRLKEQLISAFKEQMEIRRSLMELGNTNMELHIDTSRHLLTIADWEREKAQRAHKWREEMYSEKRGRKDNMTDEENSFEEFDTTEPQEVKIAKEEISMLLAEQQKTASLKFDLEQKLSSTKMKASKLEEFLPKRINNEDQRELLRLLCKVHELEVETTELQSASLRQENILRQKDFVLQHYEQHRMLCTDIIEQQKNLIDDHNIPVPEELAKLYSLYFQELEEGSLERMMMLHGLTHSTLRDGSVDNVIQELKLGNFIMELDKDDLKPGITVHEKKSLLHPRINSQLPAILSDPDSDSNKLFKKTQWSHPLVARGTVTLSPHHPSGAPLQQKPNLFKHPIAMSTMKRNSFTVQPEVHQMTSKALQEIVTGTKGISVIAARKRSQVPISDFSHDLKKGREPRVMSVHHLEDNDRKFQERSRSEPRFVLKSNVQQASSMQDLTSPSHHARVNGKMLSQPLTSNSNYSKKATQKAEQKEGSLKGKARKKRSRSLEGHSQGLLKSKHQPSSNTDHRLLNVSTSSSPFPPSKVTSTPSDETASSTRVRFPITHYKGESPLLTLEASNTPPTTIHQRNANGKKRQVLHKQVRGPAETGSTQQLLIHPGNVKKGSQGGVKNRGVNDRVTNRNGNTIKK